MLDSEWTSKGHITVLCAAMCVAVTTGLVYSGFSKKAILPHLSFLNVHPIPLSPFCGLPLYSSLCSWFNLGSVGGAQDCFHWVLIFCWPQGGPPSTCVGHYWRPTLQCPWTMSLHHSTFNRSLYLMLLHRYVLWGLMFGCSSTVSRRSVTMTRVVETLLNYWIWPLCYGTLL